MALVVAAEYFARHFLLFWFPILGALRVNDMLAAGLIYLGLAILTAPPGRRDLVDFWREAGAILATARRWQVWVAALACLATTALVAVDALLWGGVRLPSLISPWRWDLTLLAWAAPILVPASLLLVNGLVIPFVEERLWRGLIQPRLGAALGAVPGLVLTAILFSLKHALVDAALLRLVTLTAFGLVLGLLAARQGWRAAALAHALTNTAATVLALLAAGQV